MQESDYLKMLGTIEACVIVDNILWCSAYEFNLLFFLNLETGRFKYVSEIPGETKDGNRLYSSIVYHDDKLYLIPMSASELAIYDIKNEAFEKIGFKEYIDDERMYKTDYKFCGGVIKHNKLLLFSCTYPGFVELDLKDHAINYRGGWVSKMEYLSQNRNEVYFRSFYIYDNKNVIFPSCCTNYVMQYDIETDQHKFIKVGDDSMAFSDASISDNKLLLSSKNKEAIYLFDLETYELTTLYESNNRFATVCMLNCKETIYIIPYKLTHLSAFSDGKISDYVFEGECEHPMIILKGAVKGETIYMIPRGSERVCTFDTLNKRYGTLSVSFDRSFKSFFLKRINANMNFVEGKISLDDYLSCM